MEIVSFLGFPRGAAFVVGLRNRAGNIRMGKGLHVPVSKQEFSLLLYNRNAPSGAEKK